MFFAFLLAVGTATTVAYRLPRTRLLASVSWYTTLDVFIDKYSCNTQGESSIALTNVLILARSYTQYRKLFTFNIVAIIFIHNIGSFVFSD